jgi:hypothetical protein
LTTLLTWFGVYYIMYSENECKDTVLLQIISQSGA